MADNKAASKSKSMTKSDVYAKLAATTGLSKKNVAELFDALNAMIKQELGKKGPGLFTVPGLLKLKLVRKPATKARKGINPFTKEEQVFKANPARNVVKALPLKALKESVK
jgi:nucleoid DNA-binding protein